MRTREQIAKDKAKLVQAQAKIQDELADLQPREAAVLNVAVEEILAGHEGKYTQDLNNIRSRKDAMLAAQASAGQKLADLAVEIAEIERSERVARFASFEKDFWDQIIEINNLIGSDSNGLKGKLDQLYNQVQAAEAEGIAHKISMDVDIVLDRFNGVYAHAKAELGEIQEHLEILLSIKAKSKAK